MANLTLDIMERSEVFANQEDIKEMVETIVGVDYGDYSSAYRAVYQRLGLLEAYENYKAQGSRGLKPSFLSTLPVNRFDAALNGVFNNPTMMAVMKRLAQS